MFVFTGCPKTEFAFFIPDRNPMGMGVSVAGFDDQVRIGLMIDRTLMETEEEVMGSVACLVQFILASPLYSSFIKVLKQAKIGHKSCFEVEKRNYLFPLFVVFDHYFWWRFYFLYYIASFIYSKTKVIKKINIMIIEFCLCHPPEQDLFHNNLHYN